MSYKKGTKKMKAERMSHIKFFHDFFFVVSSKILRFHPPGGFVCFRERIFQSYHFSLSSLFTARMWRQPFNLGKKLGYVPAFACLYWEWSLCVSLLFFLTGAKYVFVWLQWDLYLRLIDICRQKEALSCPDLISVFLLEPNAVLMRALFREKNITYFFSGYVKYMQTRFRKT